MDGAVFAQSRKLGIGVVIQDHEGRVTVALNKKIHQLLGLLKAEAKAMEVGVFFAWDVGIRDVVFECESKIVADALLGLCTPPVVVSNILVGIAHKLQDFRSAHVPHMKCQGNKPAHILAKYAKEVENNDNCVT